MRFVDHESDRFWAIERDGRRVVTRWGRIGAAGSRRERVLETVDDAQKFVDRHVSDRRSMGYIASSEVDTAAMEGRLATDPRDLQAALVLADQLQADGDPRGELMTLLVMLDQAPPADKARLEASIADITRTHWRYLWGKAGGFPYQQQWLGRQHLQYVRTDQTLRGKAGLPLFDRVRRFLERWTDCRQVSSVRKSWDYRYWWGGSRPSMRLTKEQRARFDAVMPGGQVRAMHWKAPILPDDVDGLEATRRLIADSEQLLFTFDFRFTHPDTPHLLPFQTGALYAGWEPLLSTLSIDFVTKHVEFDIAWPFQEFDDAFFACFDGVTGDLGKVFSSGRKGWKRKLPTVRGSHLKQQPTRFPSKR